MKSILIVKMSSFGDIIQSFAALEYLKKSYPKAKIDWAVEPAYQDLVRSHPMINKVYSFDTKKWRKNFFNKEIWLSFRKMQNYDLVVDLQGNIKSGAITKFIKSPIKVGFSSKCVKEWPNIFATNRRFTINQKLPILQQYVGLLRKYRKDLLPFTPIGCQLHLSNSCRNRAIDILSREELQSPLRIMICPHSAWKNKMLDKECVKAFLKSIARSFSVSFVFVWNSSKEKELSDFFHEEFKENSLAIGDLEIPLWQHLMTHMGVVISVDSAAVHLAGLANVPTMSVFGPSSSEVYKPYGEKHLAFQGQCPYGKIFDKRCKVLRTCKSGACMKNFKAEDLYTNRFKTWVLTSSAFP